MIYVTSDWHGCSPKQTRALLELASIKESDTLYVLGDVIDRGDYGVAYLQWMQKQPNVHFLRGNHEDMLLACNFLFSRDLDLDTYSPSAAERLALEQWLLNGAKPTLRALLALPYEERRQLWAYLNAAPLYACVEAGGRRFVLVHGGLGDYHPDKPLSDYTAHDLLWTRPELDTQYAKDFVTVLGHTPTIYYGKAYAGRALQTDTWIDIDTGVAADYPPMLLRLDDMQTFYLE